MTSQPAISVLMPVRDARETVEAAVWSVLEQSCADWELVLVDDGSQDGTTEILKRFAESDDRIVLIQQKAEGIVQALRRGCEACRGEFIARMDADDVSLPNRFALQADYLSRHPECVAVGSEVLMVDPEGWPIGLRGHAREHAEIDRRLAVLVEARPRVGQVLAGDDGVFL